MEESNFFQFFFLLKIYFLGEEIKHLSGITYWEAGAMAKWHYILSIIIPRAFEILKQSYVWN